MCGIFSAGFSFGLDAALPLRDAALQVGVAPLYARLPSYVLIMGGGAIVNLCYCFTRLAFKKDISLRADLAQPRPTLLLNSALAASGGIMWYLQFFFYSWGEANIPRQLDYVNWMLHMSLYVLCGGLVGLALGEWVGVGRKPIRLLWAGILVIIAAANLVGLGMAS
jgi:L-rhamnose-H+ transport protein